MSKLVILIKLLIFSQFISISMTYSLSDDYAVLIPGGNQVADEIARKYGMRNKGQIGDLHNYFHFVPSLPKQTSSTFYSDLLRNESDVFWMERQVYEIRVNRGAPKDFKDPLYPEQWFINSRDGNDVNVIPVWKEGITGKGVVVAVLDDGLQKNHPDLVENFDPYASMDVIDEDNDPTPIDDKHSHGTNCAGIVAATANNQFCGVGVAYNARIGGVRMLNSSGLGEAAALGFRFNYIDIYSSSWGPLDDGKTFSEPYAVVKTSIEEGILKGRKGLGSIFVWASGNGGRYLDNCNCDGYVNSIFTIAVGSATKHNSHPWYGEKCAAIMTTAYSGGNLWDPRIVTTDLYLKYNEVKSLCPAAPCTEKLCTRSFTGTSACAPTVAGICALALEANPKLTWRDMQHIIVKTSNPQRLLKEDGWITNGAGLQVSSAFGFGLMDALAMVTLAKNWKSVGKHQMCVQIGRRRGRKIPRMITSITDSIKTSACYNKDNRILFLEHVEVVITLEFETIGKLDIFITSPQNTTSAVLQRRPLDDKNRALNDFTLMSVQFWGEDPRGTWLLKVSNTGNSYKDDFIFGTQIPTCLFSFGGKAQRVVLKVVICGDSKKDGRLISWTLVFYGTNIPVDVNPEKGQSGRVMKKYAENSDSKNQFCDMNPDHPCLSPQDTIKGGQQLKDSS